MELLGGFRGSKVESGVFAFPHDHDPGTTHGTAIDAAPEVDPQSTIPGRFEGSPDWQSHGSCLGDRSLVSRHLMKRG